MKSQITTAIDDHSKHFDLLIRSIANKFEPLQIFRFSKSSIIQTDQGCFNNDQVSFHCNYCLLLVTESATRIDYEVQDFVNSQYDQGLITVICHGQKTIKEAIQANNRFFISVFTSGNLLYSKDGITSSPPIPLFVPTKAASKALKHYSYRLPLAEGFLLCASECLEKEQYGIGAFMLHQAVEQTCICMVRVHIAYRSEFHNLYRLLRLCLCFSNRPYQLFLSTPEDERLFDVMAKSYSGARYKDDFSVSKQDAESLFQRTRSFIDLATEMCEVKIKQLKQQAAIFGVQHQNQSCDTETAIKKETEVLQTNC
jgi:HEPN domain-containing protein